MATLRITEFPSLGFAGSQVGLTPSNAEQVITYTTSTQSSAFQVDRPAGAGTKLVRLYAVDDAYIVFGASPTATTAAGMFLAAGTTEYFSVTPGHKLAVYDGVS